MLFGNTDKHESKPSTHEVDDALVPAAITDTGCERDLNEDRYAVIDSPSGLAWIVCDGMGGVTGGELAAQLAIDGMRRDLEGLPPRMPETAMRSAILEANRIIVLRRQNQAFSSMGTTVTGALFSGIEVAIANVGDSRAYVFNAQNIRQVTVDHTFVQQLVDSGQIKPEEALTHPQAHILTRAIGSEPGLKVDVDRYWIWEAGPGEESDSLLLCTDGLYSHVSDSEMLEIINRATPQAACIELVELAKQRGGFDNITIAIVPLGGLLKNEPPLGYEDTQLRQSKAVRNKGPRNLSSSLLKTLITVVILSLLFSLFVVLAIGFSLSK